MTHKLNESIELLNDCIIELTSIDNNTQNLVKSIDTLTDNSIVRGSGGQKNVQSSGVYIDNNGRLGIGMNNPTIHLAIGDNDTGFQQQGDGELAVYTDNQERVRFDSSGRVGIGINNPASKLHVYEATGTPHSATAGTILLEKGNSGGQQSIVFKSKVNQDSDYGYINYRDNYSNGANDGTEKSLMEIGVQNDGSGVHMDAIRLSSSSSTGYGYLNQYGFSVCGNNKFIGYNAYYDDSWRAAETGYCGNIKCDNSGTFLFENTDQSYTKGSVISWKNPLKIYQDGTFMSLGKAQGFGECRLGHNNSNENGSFRKILLRCADLPNGGSSDSQIYFIRNGSFKSWDGISSDGRIKLNQVNYPPEDSLNLVKQIKVKKYLNTDFNHEVHGFVAQDIEAIPEISYSVTTHDLTEGKGISDFKMLDYRRVQVHAFGAIQALLTKIEALEARIQVLEGN